MARLRKFFLAIPCAAWLSVAAPVGAATITIVNNDGPGEGFNDGTVVGAVGGNPGTTLGQQRLNVFQRAADIWGSVIPSAVTIRVHATFDALTPCDGTGGVLGAAGAYTYFYDFPGAPFPSTLYPAALADKLAGGDLNGYPDVVAQFNSSVDDATCLGASSWYYGYDGNEGSNVELLPVVLHELGHGLGFSSGVNVGTGAFPGSGTRPTAYAKNIRDNSTGMQWDAMTNAQRVTSAVNTGNVVWSGPATTAVTANFLARKPLVRVNAPAAIAGEYPGVNAVAGSGLSNPGQTAPVVQSLDGSGVTTDACEPITNGAAVAGKIALVDRGTCPFVTKALNVQNAGAVGVIIVNHVAGLPPDPLTGSDPAIHIPITGISQSDGATLKGQLGNGLNATLHVDPVALTAADASNRLKLYTPNPVQPGSSISHWDVSAFPNLLMEPAINGDLHDATDITRHLLRDIGWFNGGSTTAVPDGRIGVQLRSAPNPFGDRTAVTFTLARTGEARLEVFALDGRRVRSLPGQRLGPGSHRIVWDGRDDAGNEVAAGVYQFRLRAPDFEASGRTVRLP
jgi:hypothetical protein